MLRLPILCATFATGLSQILNCVFDAELFGRDKAGENSDLSTRCNTTFGGGFSVAWTARVDELPTSDPLYVFNFGVAPGHENVFVALTPEGTLRWQIQNGTRQFGLESPRVILQENHRYLVTLGEEGFMQLYVDGVRVAQGLSGVVLSHVARQLMVGRGLEGGHIFEGFIEDMFIFQNEITWAAAEVQPATPMCTWDGGIFEWDQVYLNSICPDTWGGAFSAAFTVRIDASDHSWPRVFDFAPAYHQNSVAVVITPTGELLWEHYVAPGNSGAIAAGRQTLGTRHRFLMTLATTGYMQMFIDGEKVGEMNSPRRLAKMFRHLLIGSGMHNHGPLFGKLEDFYLFNAKVGWQSAQVPIRNPACVYPGRMFQGKSFEDLNGICRDDFGSSTSIAFTLRVDSLAQGGSTIFDFGPKEAEGNANSLSVGLDEQGKLYWKHQAELTSLLVTSPEPVVVGQARRCLATVSSVVSDEGMTHNGMMMQVMVDAEAVFDSEHRTGPAVEHMSRTLRLGVGRDGQGFFNGEIETFQIFHERVSWPSAQDGGLICWGDNTFQQASVPYAIDKLAQVSTGWQHACAVREANFVSASSGRRLTTTGWETETKQVFVEVAGLVCWGDDLAGQRSIPSSLKQPGQVAAGAYHSCALEQAGTVVCWGSNSHGQCDVPSQLVAVVQVTAGYQHTCVLIEDGSVNCWGGDSFGQVSVPADTRDVSEISAGSYHTCARSKAGLITCWGDNSYGQINVPARYGTALAAQSVVAGQFHSCALSQDGQLHCWGANFHGQADVPLSLGPVASISAGLQHTCAVTEAGAVNCWGSNHVRQLNVQGQPKLVAKMASGPSHTPCALREVTPSQNYELYVGGAGQALQFDGVNDFAWILEVMPCPPFTITFWVRPDEATPDLFRPLSTVLSRCAARGIRNNLPLFAVSLNGLALETKDGLWKGQVNPTAHHFHVGLVFEDTVATMYLNGNAIQTITGELDGLCQPSAAALVEYPWILGASMSHDSDGRFYLNEQRAFKGQIDEMQWWSRNLTREEVRRWMVVTPRAGEPGLIRRWAFDETQALDLEASGISEGGGGGEQTPARVPSLMPTVGGPVSIHTVDSAAPSQHRLCAAVLPAVAGASASVCFPSAAGTVGKLEPSWGTKKSTQECALLLDLLPQAPSTAWSGSVVTLLCSDVTFVPSSRGQETLNFTVTAQLPASGSHAQLVSQGTVQIRVDTNTPPVAGLVAAVSLDGEDDFLPLGGLDLHAEELSFSVWVKPDTVSENSRILTQHTSDTGLFAFGFTPGGYLLQMACRETCNRGQGTTTSRAVFPVVNSSSDLLPSGKTVAEVVNDRGSPHLLTVTMRCHSRGSLDPNVDPARTTATMYVDGLSVGQTAMDSCWYSSPQNRPPWLLGAEYPEGYQRRSGGEQTGFFSGIIDDVRFWNKALSAQDVLSLVAGGDVQPEALVAHHTFDVNSAPACVSWPLVDSSDACFNLWHGQGAPEVNTSTEGSFKFVGSPFRELHGSTLHKTMLAGTCESVPLEGFDPDGDSLTFHLSEGFNRSDLTLLNSQSYTYLQFCSGLDGLERDVEVRFKVCDALNLCDVGQAVFHVRAEGPSISTVQLLPESSTLRLLFSEPTNTPAADDAQGLMRLLDVSGLPPNTTLLPGDWETGGTVLRLIFSKAGFVGTPPDWMRDLLLEPNGTAFEKVGRIRVKLKHEGLLRDDASRSFPSNATSSSPEVLICGPGKVLHPGALVCLGCPAGSHVIASEGTCVECNPGWHQSQSGQDHCVACPMGRYAQSAGMVNCTSCDETLPGSTTLYQGSRHPDSCVCPPGSAWSRETSSSAPPTCKDCGTGLLCTGGRLEQEDPGGPEVVLDHRPPLLAAGFSGGAPLWVGGDPSYLVRCSSRTLCPGDLPLGACPGETRGRACARCAPGTYKDDGDCRPCDHADDTSTAVSVLVFIVALGLIYFVGNKPPAVFCNHIMTITNGFAVVFAALQVVGALATMNVPWPEPIPSIRDKLSIIVLDIDHHRLQCFSGLESALVSYVGSLAVYPVIASILTCALCVKRWVLGHKISISQSINMHGMGLMSIFTSIAVVSLLPLKCRSDNPDGSSNVEAYRSVVCWTTQEHIVMVVFSILSLLVFVVGFIAVLCWATLTYPSTIKQPGGGIHMVRFRFLFGSFTPKRYYFGLLFGMRKLMIALAPMLAVNVPQAQLLFVMLAISGNMAFQCALWPWRTFNTNVLDALIAILLMMLIMVGYLTGEFDETENRKVAIFMAACSLCCGMVVFTTFFTYYLYNLINRGRAYSYFLSHHKVGAGMLARWLKMLLIQNGETRVFLDSDDLRQLDKLINIVANETETVVVLLTKETLTRPWCAMELAAAFKKSIRVIPVSCNGFEGINTEFLDGLPSVWSSEELSTMMSGGITLADVRKAYETLQSTDELVLTRDGADVQLHKLLVKAIIERSKGAWDFEHQPGTGTRSFSFATSFTSHISGLSRSTLTRMTYGRRKSNSAGSAGSIFERTRSSESNRCRIAILSDMGSEEVACGCRVIQTLLQEQLQESVAFEEDCEGLRPYCLLVVLRTGIFKDLSFATALVRVSDDPGVKEMIPVLVDDFSTFPSTDFWTDLKRGKVLSTKELERNSCTLMKVEAAYRRLCNTLAMRFSGHSSTDIQFAEIVAMVNRIRARIGNCPKNAKEVMDAEKSVSSAKSARTGPKSIPNLVADGEESVTCQL